MIRPRERQSTTATSRHYDALDGLYRTLWGEHVHHGLWHGRGESPEVAVRQLVDHVARRAEIGRGQCVVDIGCGYGATARQLHADLAAEVTAITVSPAQHRHARAVSPEPIRFLLGDWLTTTLPRACFDAAIAIESTEHMQDKAGCFARMARVLKPGGRAVVCAWLAGPRAGRLARRHLLEPICREGRLAGMGTAAEYRGWMERAGLEVTSVEDLTRSVRRTWGICIGRVLRRIVTDREMRAFLLDPDNPERVFGLTLARIWVAYRSGSMRYGVISGRKLAGSAT